MNFRDSNQGSGEAKYISKKVMVNGQFVTLYSANGQTWVSSPEEIPALMERLDNARISLNFGERVAEGEGDKQAKPEVKEKEKEEDKAAPQKILQTKYRMKGPKPRPILRQDGVVIKGTPIEPISASDATMTFSSDVEEEVRPVQASAGMKKAPKRKGPILKAPVLPKKVAPVAASKSAKAVAGSAKANPEKAAKSSVANKTAAVKPVAAKSQKGAVVKAAAPKAAKDTKSSKKAATTPAVKAAKKPAPKPAAKKQSAKKGSKKGKSSRR